MCVGEEYMIVYITRICISLHRPLYILSLSLQAGPQCLTYRQHLWSWPVPRFRIPFARASPVQPDLPLAILFCKYPQSGQPQLARSGLLDLHHLPLTATLTLKGH